MSDPHLDTLLEQARWVRQLARSLVRDPDLAEDLAQDAMVIALEHADAPPRSMRGWLASIVRHRLWERMRSEDRRSAREEDSARREAEESTAEVVARASAHRSVVETLMELPEPYRDVLLLRYFEGEPPTAIAQKTGVPIATVKTRLQRGLAAMRERLDRRNGGDGKGWLSALAPLLRPTEAASTAPALPLAALVGLVLVTGTAITLTLGPRFIGRDPAPQRFAPGPSPAPLVIAQPPGEEPAPVEDRTSLGAGLPGVAGTENARLPAVVRGTVSDPAGRPRAGVVLRYRSDEEDSPASTGTVVAVSDATGSFELHGVHGRGRVQALSEDLVNLFSGEAGGYDEWTPHVVVAPRIELGGRVVDTDGVPLIGAHVEVRWSAEAQPVTGAMRSWRERFATLTNDAGEYQLGAPRLPEAELLISLDGYAPQRSAALGEERLLVTLVPEVSDAAGNGRWLAGRVLDTDGRPVEGARVSNTREETRSTRDGTFRLRAPGAGGSLLAALPGWLPARVPTPEDGPWPDSIELRLGGEALEISGRVVDGAGNGLRGIHVAVQDPTVFLARPRQEVEDVVQVWRDDPAPSTDRARPVLLESLLAQRPTALSTGVVTGTDGTFTLSGLADRSYVVLAIDPMSLAQGRSQSTPAGTEDLALELTTRVLPRIEGRVVDEQGEAIRGVTVHPLRSLQELRLEEQPLHRTDLGSRAALSDEDGSFFLSEVAPEGAFLRLDGPDVLPAELPLVLGEGGRLVLVAQRSAWVTVVDAPWPEGEVWSVDAAGNELPAIVTEGGRRTRRKHWPLAQGRSPVMQVAITARELVLEGVAGESLRIPLALSVGEQNTVRP